MSDPIDQAKDVLGIEDSDEKKKEDIEEKKAAGDSTDRERMELDEIKEKERQETDAE